MVWTYHHRNFINQMFICCNYQLFRISPTLTSLLVSVGFVTSEEIQKKRIEISETLLLKIFCNLVPVVRPTHHYVYVAGLPNKNRVNKEFYTFLNNIHKNKKVNKISVSSNLDKFYTKPEIATCCVSHFRNHIKVTKNDLIIEPSAGNGSFLLSLNKINCKKCYLDVIPENEQILQQNFLKYSAIKSKNKIHVIGNPPFGKQSSMAIKFIKHAATFADSISFILPKSFKKDSLKKRIPLNFHLLYQIDLPENSFFVSNNLCKKVPCIFQIWKKKNSNRKKVLPLKPKNFVFVKKDQNPHIAFCRVGAGAGKISIDWLDKNIQTHYFIRFKTSKIFEKFLKLQRTFIFESKNTVAAKSISKQELIKNCDKLL